VTLLAREVAGVGVGLKPEHADLILTERPELGFFEIHAENYMGAGGPPHRLLEAVRETYPLSVHGVGLSIGGSDPLDREHLRRLRAVVDRYRPGVVSEHLAWSTHAGRFLNDLLPVPLTDHTLATVADHVAQVQDVLGRRILLENPATYVLFEESRIPETEYLRLVAERTGCGLLLDVGNVCVSAANHGFDGAAYLDGFPMAAVGEIHLAGYDEERDADGGRLLIDAHGSPVQPEVWRLYRHALTLSGPRPTLIEWDTEVPAWLDLLAQAQHAAGVLAETRRG
jgi:uncharacterized protein